MKKILFGLLLLGLAGTAFAADTKITGLTADTAPTTDDLVTTVDDPAGTPANKKATLANLSKGLTVTSMISACSDAQVLGGTAGGTGVECQTDVDTDTKWDGGSTGLTAATGRTSLGLGTAATTAATDYLGSSAKAADADLLDSHDTSYFQTALTYPVTGVASPTAGYLTKWGVSGNAIVDGPKIGTFTDGKWCSYSTAGGVACTENAPAGAGDMVLASVQSVTGLKTFDKDKIAMKGTSTGVTTFSTANTSATDYTITLPAETGTVCTTGSVCSGYSPSTAPTFATSITGSYLTASEILGTGASKEIVSLPVAAYPSLTELSYVKGLSSAVQTQIGGKLTIPTNDTNVANVRHQWHVSIINPNAVVTASAVVPICTLTDAALTVTKVVVSTSSASYEAAGDLKYADARIGLGTATVINDFDTTSGVRSDTSITSGAVASGKFVYLSFDSAPSASMTDVVVDVYWDYDA